jgi:hypothetical protein
MKSIPLCLGLLAGAAALSFPIAAVAYEADVHFGLTRWLALRAGFNESQADAIAVADQRVDAGRVDSTELDLEYACAGRFPEVAQLAQRGHYPAEQAVPAPAADRVVQAGSAAARRELAEVTAAAKGKEGLMLGRFGRALHPLQDSWAHQGTPSRPQPGQSLGCDAALVSGHPTTRGGPDAHAADLTTRWPADTLAMAHATYDELLKWGAVEGQPRQPAPWESLAPLVEAFAKAATKTQKRAWFVAQGVPDTSFLEGISLPDGPDPGVLAWNGRMLPPLPGTASQQHDAPADVRAFFDRFLARWLGSERIEDVLAEMGPGKPRAAAHASEEVPRSPAELAARLKLWKLRDHGSAAELAHAPAPLTAAQLKAVERLTRSPAAYVAPTSVAEALYSLQPSTPAPMPMLPYIVRALPAAAGGAPRMIAIARLKHAPSDTVGWIAEKRGERWVLIDMVSSVDL